MAGAKRVRAVGDLAPATAKEAAMAVAAKSHRLAQAAAAVKGPQAATAMATAAQAPSSQAAMMQLVRQLQVR